MPKDFDLGTKGFDHGESHHGYSDNGDSLGHDPYRCPSKSSNPEAGDISEDKKRLYGLALAPVSTHTGYPYPCRQEDLDSYSLKKKKLTRFGDFLKDVAFYWPSNTDDAVREIEAFLDPERPPSAEEQSAVDRLCQVLCLENGEWTPDVPIKAFRDLDTVFFQRRLCGNVKVGWVSGEEMPPGTIGTTAYKFNGHSKIMLDADHYIFESEHPWRKMWRTLLHEMVVSNLIKHATKDGWTFN
ncbi:MAG: hypothetical protein LQ351_005163 [Letrouitia transgressa]|nr:MAG: hypothetical protein LQ351_005163 [Letrouitia transgressa]